MIRTDLILPKDWEKIFRKNNPKTEPETFYRVGKIDDNLVVLNTNTMQIMDYFYDDVADEWINAFPALSILSKYRETRVKLKSILKDMTKDNCRWYINKNTCYLKTITRDGREIIMTGGEKTYGYPTFTISRIINLPCHILIATMFVPNDKPRTYNLVNHKRDDTNVVNNFNFKKEYLEWRDYSYNNKYDRIKPKKAKYIYLLNNTWWNERDLMKKSNLSRNKLRKIVNSCGTLFGHTLYGYTELAKEYIEINRAKNPIWWNMFFDTTWRYCSNTKNTLVNACGVFKKGNMYSVGSLHNYQNKERRLFKTNHPVSRLVYMAFYPTFTNTSDLTLDHINDDVFDNRIINLQILSREDNVRKMLFNRD